MTACFMKYSQRTYLSTIFNLEKLLYSLGCFFEHCLDKKKIHRKKKKERRRDKKNERKKKRNKEKRKRESERFFKYAFSLLTFRILNLYDKSPKIFAFHIFGIKCCLQPSML